MIEDPAWKLGVSVAETDSIQASPDVTRRIEAVLKTVRASASDSVPPLKTVVTSEVSPHSGLGSGTQLALAAGVAAELLSGKQRSVSCRELAASLGRNRRSAIGSFGFDKGGFIVDTGRAGDPADAVRSVCFPEDWRLVLVTPSTEQGLSGTSEESFFGEQQFLSDDVVLELERLVEQEILIAIAEADFDRFATNIAEYGRVAGEYYSAAQGGTFSNAVIREVVSILEQHQIYGAAQSSWGPTICVPARSAESALEIRNLVEGLPAGANLNVTVTKARNCGADIRSSAPESQRSLG